MRRFVRWSLAVLAATLVAVGAGVAVGLAWNDRAEDLCREETPNWAGGGSATWEWSELAYVCEQPGEQKQKRVGIVDAFHGEGQRPHP